MIHMMMTHMMMILVLSYNLFLDDNRSLEMAWRLTGNQKYMTKEWEVVRNYDEFVEHIEEHGMPDLISYDHDLGDVSDDPEHKEKTGLTCVKWLVDYCLDNDLNMKSYMIHTNNPAGYDNIHGLIQNFVKFKQDGTKL